MTLDNLPDAFRAHLRVAIIACLMHGPLDFRSLRDATGASDGNLSVQLSNLEKMGYLLSKKEFVCRKSRSTYSLTALGREEFRSYVTLLIKKIV